MAHVLVIQRNAHLAGDIRLEQVNGRDGPIARAQVTAISNVRWGAGVCCRRPNIDQLQGLMPTEY